MNSSRSNILPKRSLHSKNATCFCHPNSANARQPISNRRTNCLISIASLINSKIKRQCQLHTDRLSFFAKPKEGRLILSTSKLLFATFSPCPHQTPCLRQCSPKLAIFERIQSQMSISTPSFRS